ncbi:hypothetical protein ACEPAG_3796 [Sanghuangporus baumii]
MLSKSDFIDVRFKYALSPHACASQFRMTCNPSLMTVQSMLVACFALTFVAYCLKNLSSKHSGLPPGPKGKWIVGNAADVFAPYQWIKFMNWSKLFGDIIYLTVLGRPVIILNKFEDARELMDRRGALYSDRPPMTYIVDMLKVRSPTFMPYGDDWRTHRRLIQQYLNVRSVTAFHSLQTRCVHELLEDLAAQPDAFWKHVKRFAASAILSATYGYRVTRGDDPLIKLNTHSERAIIALGPPGSTLVDFFPFLRYFPSFIPGVSFKKVADAARVALRSMCDLPYEMVKEQRAAGTAESSLLSRMLDDAERQGAQDETRLAVIKNVCGAMYRAGVATTSATLYVFILAMVRHPDVVRKAQQQIDSVTGGERLPAFEDQASISYITCIMKECLRWAPPFPLGLSHRVMEDNDFEGKFIPKGSIIMPNIWKMMHDERNYSNPEKFYPDRFMLPSSQILDPAAAVFGFGRRICPGRHFAEADLWLAMASILAVFDILPAVDERGTEILPKVEFVPGINSFPKEFTCRFVPRSAQAASLVEKMEEKSASYT